ncbi:predicted protein [Sclerotinia sclerotiorum 1980 UF-70]|uniref:Uncharacterized protein n=1 Tax=Sclerotinia sclerotiorum (strain ATCC 18683 / 1980 / Ss-1) TaxID=665079 RepID=A7EU55_SCLS1|nr:predicted protein [Sclerotinia sclerotiorum 1980 UF-70]EDN92997.1 predicted protein [Sclerotinia sclerotiorum 1980 UF-70]
MNMSIKLLRLSLVTEVVGLEEGRLAIGNALCEARWFSWKKAEYQMIPVITYKSITNQRTPAFLFMTK